MSKELDEAFEKLKACADSNAASAMHDTLKEYLELEAGQVFYAVRQSDGSISPPFGTTEKDVQSEIGMQGITQSYMEAVGHKIARFAVIPIVEVLPADEDPVD